MNEQDDAVTKVLKVFPDAVPLQVVDTRWTKKDFRKFVDSQNWVQAKSDYFKKYAPHQYTLKGTYPNPEQKTVINAGRYIEQHGIKVEFYNHGVYTVYVIDGWRYWYMKNDDETNVGVNRAKMTDTQGLPPEAVRQLSQDTEVEL